MLHKDRVNTSTYGAAIWRNNENDAWAGGGITLDFTDNERHRMSWDNVKVYYFDNTTTESQNPIANTLQVFAQNGKLRIAANEATEAEIYNVSSILLSRQTVKNEIIIQLNSGIYFVKSDNKTKKVAVR